MRKIVADVLARVENEEFGPAPPPLNRSTSRKLTRANSITPKIHTFDGLLSSDRCGRIPGALPHRQARDLLKPGISCNTVIRRKHPPAKSAPTWGRLTTLRLTPGADSLRS